MEFHSRRQFAKLLASATAVGVAAPLALNLSSFASASAENSGEYKALICLNLGGGNDHINTFPSMDEDSYRQYASARGTLSIALDELHSMPAASPQNGLELGFNPKLGGLKQLYDRGRLAVVTNVGPLIGPTTKAEIETGKAALPAFLGSHNDQQRLWLTQSGTAGTGWGGRFADHFSDSNAIPALTQISTSGFSFFSVGERTSALQIGEYGEPELFFEPGSAMEAAVTGSGSRSNLLEAAYAQTNEALRDSTRNLLAAMPSTTSLAPPPGIGKFSLAQQLQSVVRAIAASKTLGIKRQIFIVSHDGFDTHSNQLIRHSQLLEQLDQSILYFDLLLGSLGLQKNVTLFSTSEFGRAYVPNNGGTDHGWASHHIVVGGAVRGGNVFGKIPNPHVNGPDFYSGGMMIPSISTTQYAATLGKWMGVPTPELSRILPDLQRFDQADIGFLN